LKEQNPTGWEFPDGERHMNAVMRSVNRVVDGRLTYQYHKYEACLQLIPKGKRKTAIDIGSHIGLWAYWLTRDFEFVHCFEPMPEHRRCFLKNMKGRDNYTLRGCALGDHFGEVRVKTWTDGSSGDTGVAEDGHLVPLQPLDSPYITDVSLIKVDCEGYELYPLKGAEETILKWKPVIIVEQKDKRTNRYGLKPRAAVDYLESLGMHRQALHEGDYILSF
jgi:FkbM family methyltransferase